jgi:hypothetical protein
MPKWVGFDMDECIGSVMPLYAFVKHLPVGRPRDALKEALFASESSHATWLIRPAIFYTLDILHRAWKAGAIAGAFILSNNSSQELVNFIAEFLNMAMARQFGTTDAAVFKMAVCRNSPVRTPGSLEKSFSEVQRALSGYGLPLLTSERDLLFFDDMVHVLTGEIRDYIQVRAYFNHCPIDRVIAALASCEPTVGKLEWDRIVAKARHYEKTDGDRLYKYNAPSSVENAFDRNMFQQAFRRFLGPAYPLKGAGKTRRSRRQQHHRKSRKNTLRLK